MATTKSLDGVLTKKAHQKEKFDEAWEKYRKEDGAFADKD